MIDTKEVRRKLASSPLYADLLALAESLCLELDALCKPVGRWPDEGQIVFVYGGVAQYRNGTYYSGMEDPRWMRPIVWDVTWWHPINQDPVAALEVENRRLREAAAEMYQYAGVVDAPVEVLDNLSALAQGEALPHPWDAGLWKP